MDKKQLYIGACMSDLNKKAIYNFDQGRSTRIHITHSDKTFKAAEEARTKGDEERAYILFMRYLDIFQKVRQSREYKKDESHFSLLLGSKQCTDAIANAEKLSKSLKERYEKLKESSTDNSAEKESKQINGVLTPKVSNSSSTPTEKKPKPATEPQEKKDASTIPVDAKSITSQKLYEILFANRMTGIKVLMMDIRNSEEYKESCIRHPMCINVPKTHIKPGTTTRKVEDGIKEIEHLQEWKNRATADVIVMLDWDSSEKRLNDVKDPLCSLKDALWKWDQEVFLKREPVLLAGGYTDWLDYFPQFSTNPKVQRPSSKPTNITSVTSLIDFSYSDLILPAVKETKSEVTLESEHNKNKEDEENWSNAEYLEQTNRPKTAEATDSNRDVSRSMTNGPSSQSLYPDVPKDISIGGMQSDRKLDKVLTDIKKPDYPGPLVNGAYKKNIPSVDRTTKPVIPKRSLKPQTDTNESNAPEIKPATVNTAGDWPPNSFTDPPTLPPTEPVQNNTEEEMMATLNRIAAMKKQKEEAEQKRKQIEEKKRLAELRNVEQRMQEEIEEENRKSKIAEKELAEKMRELAKPGKPKAEKEVPDSVVKKAASTQNQSSKVEQPKKPIPSETELNKPVIPSVPREKKPEVELDKKEMKKEDASVKKDDKPTAKEPIYATVSKSKPDPANPPTTASSAKSFTTVANDLKPKTIEPTSRVQKPELPKPNVQQPPVTPPTTQKPRTEQATKPVDPEKKQVQAEGAVTKKPGDPYANKKLVKTNDVKPAIERSQPKKPPQLKAEPPKPQASPGNIERKGSTNLPINWEKRLDSKTGRYFYLDHNTQTTHWMLPSNVVVSQVKKVPLKDTASSGGGLKRSHSTPNIAQLAEDEEKIEAKSKPLIPSRSNKPSIVPEAIPDPPEVYTERLLRLHPVFGGPGPGLCGLQNLGNTCYMNSVLQCMFNTTLLAEYFLKHLYKRDINRENFLGSGGEITDGFAMLLKAVWQGKYKHLTPRDFRHTISKFNPRFGGYTQQDSQELLLFLMDGLHEDLNTITKRNYIEEEDNDKLDDETAADIAWKHHKRLNESIIVELFQGQFKATVQCLHCRKTSRKFDVFMYLSLPLPSNSCSIDECIENFSKIEKLSGDNKWRCPACKTERDAVRKMEIWKLPPVLLIHFKRFSFAGRWRDKVQTSVSFPSTGLDMNKYAKGRNVRKQYNLYSVSHHHGASLDSGHYVASCKSPLDGNWYKYDDHEVSRATVPQGPSAYILCYTSLKHALSISYGQ